MRGQCKAGHWVAHDWDFATDAMPERVTQLFDKVIPTGIDHGTVTVIIKGLELQVTTLRTEQNYRDGRRPEGVRFVSRIDDDLARRDFTVNAMAFDPAEERLIDPHGGLADLQAGCLRAVGAASQRFAEDGLRVLRATRFVAALEFELEAETAVAIRPSLATYARVSPERIREELNKTLSARQPSRGLRAMLEHGLLEITAPELVRGTSPTPISPTHLEQAFRRVDQAPRRRILRLGALLWNVEAGSTVSAQLAERLLVRLRYSNAERKATGILLANADVPLDARGAADVRRWLHRVSPDHWRDACSLQRAELAARSHAAGLSELDAFEQTVEGELASRPPLRVADLAIDGTALLTHGGVSRGPQVGRMLRALLDRVLEDPRLNTEEQLLAIARAAERG